MSTRTALRRTSPWLVALVCAAAAVVADDVAYVTPQDELPSWAADDAMQLNLSVAGEWLPQQYTVVPLTENLGANMSNPAHEIVQINGDLRIATQSNYNSINKPDDIAYLSCDAPDDDSFIQPDKMLNDLMRVKPKAIIFYSTSNNWCALTQTGPMDYTTILSMVDTAESQQVLTYLNGTTGTVKATIVGNNTSSDTDSSHHGPNKSSVAMSILYTITGLVTLLFVIIIATGAVRAHRYPERYGPRGAAGGRPRQSRAKGIARAVLDTIPIVKFNNQQPTKPDPELELETGTTDGQDVGPHRSNSNASKEMSGGAAVAGHAAATPRSSSVPDQVENPDGAHLGCTICTEDFKVGEDVRVLPCSHQFHPNCIDPWLINVSGTCPLCRFDLQKGHSNRVSTAEDGSTLPPPLAWDAEDDDGEGASAPQRNRLSRIFDLNRLRQATREEQMETLRQIVAERRQHPPAEGDLDERRQATGFTEKLKEKFRIRTRAQSPQRNEG